MICIQCKKETTNPKFCGRSCAVTFNNKIAPKRKRSGPINCIECNNELPITAKKYCSRNCQTKYRVRPFIKAWLNNEISGLTTTGTLATPLKKYLISERGNKCELCGWNKKNPITNKVPIVADHIDGNWQNNRPENIRLICPNCNSIQSTYKALNTGKGREWRRKS